MKKTLLILLSISLFSCNNNYKEAKELYEKGILVKSKSSLDKPTLKALKVSEEDSDYNKAQDILQKIDSVKYLWNNNNLIEIREKQAESQRKLNEKRRNDSLRNIEKERLMNEINDKKTAFMNQYEAKLKKDDKNYPNLVGRWILNEINYLSSLNSVVRIYQKNGIFYKSMIRDKSGNESTLKLIKKSSKRYDVVGKSDYCIINKEGELEFWDKEGYLLTCKKTKEIKIPVKKTKDSIIKNAKGKNVFNYRYENELGNPETLPGTNNTYWISYYSKLDITLISLKKTDKILNATSGRNQYISID